MNIILIVFFIFLGVLVLRLLYHVSKREGSKLLAFFMIWCSRFDISKIHRWDDNIYCTWFLISFRFKTLLIKYDKVEGNLGSYKIQDIDMDYWDDLDSNISRMMLALKLLGNKMEELVETVKVGDRDIQVAVSYQQSTAHRSYSKFWWVQTFHEDNYKIEIDPVEKKEALAWSASFFSITS